MVESSEKEEEEEGGRGSSEVINLGSSMVILLIVRSNIHSGKKIWRLLFLSPYAEEESNRESMQNPLAFSITQVRREIDIQLGIRSIIINL